MFFADNRLLGAGRAIENKLGKPAFQRSDGTEYVVIAKSFWRVSGCSRQSSSDLA